MYTLEGVSSVANFINAYEESQYNRGSHFLSVMCSLFPKVFFYFYFTSLQLVLVSCGGRKTSPRTSP